MNKGLPAGTLVGNYSITEPIGEGGMGAVYRARHRSLTKEAAVKVLLDPRDEELVARFRREADALASLNNCEQIVQLYDFGQLQGADGATHHYLAMELVVGHSLAARLQREGRLTPPAVVVVLYQVCMGLEAGHARPEGAVVHRDLKPGNVVLGGGDSGLQVKLLDYGIAKVAGLGGLTRTNFGAGTPLFSSPEQLEGLRHAGVPSDLYSCALLAYVALCGAAPYKPWNSQAELFARVAMGDLLPVRRHLPELSEEVAAGIDRFFARALAKDPAQRYTSALELARQLHRALAPLIPGRAVSLPGAAGALLLPPGSAQAPPTELALVQPDPPRPAGPAPVLPARVGNRHLPRLALGLGIATALAATGIWPAPPRRLAARPKPGTLSVSRPEPETYIVHVPLPVYLPLAAGSSPQAAPPTRPPAAGRAVKDQGKPRRPSSRSRSRSGSGLVRGRSLPLPGGIRAKIRGMRQRVQ